MGIVKLALHGAGHGALRRAAALQRPAGLGAHCISCGPLATVFYFVASDYFQVVRLKGFLEFWKMFRGSESANLPRRLDRCASCHFRICQKPPRFLSAARESSSISSAAGLSPARVTCSESRVSRKNESPTPHPPTCRSAPDPAPVPADGRAGALQFRASACCASR